LVLALVLTLHAMITLTEVHDDAPRE
jgi:hypothetical protein